MKFIDFEHEFDGEIVVHLSKVIKTIKFNQLEKSLHKKHKKRRREK